MPSRCPGRIASNKRCHLDGAQCKHQHAALQANDQTSDQGVRWAPSRCVLVSDAFSGHPGPEPSVGRILGELLAGSSESTRGGMLSGTLSPELDYAGSPGSLSPMSSAASGRGAQLLGDDDPVPGKDPSSDPGIAWRGALQTSMGKASGSGDEGGGDGDPGRRGSAGASGLAAAAGFGGAWDGSGFGAGRLPQVESRGSSLNGSSYRSPHLGGDGGAARGAFTAMVSATVSLFCCKAMTSSTECSRLRLFWA